MAASFEIIKTYFVPGFETNTILVSNGGDAALVDPNGDRRILEKAAAGRNLRAIYLTHGHFDHISAANGWNVPVYMSALDIPVARGFSDMILRQAGYDALGETIDMKPGETEFLPGLRARAMAAPGHSPGQLCFYFEPEGVFLSGDFIFDGAAGRTDLLGGDPAAMGKSLEEFKKMNIRARVIPGHGPEFNL
ncbi:MAG: MBL fold metallo-hydrolase [Rickettsiales bacterium]|jgi:glyoxylase-like metal-dependent hydrolase (beta-lactamase superfamily II)|nr:MBL fold metallo-hydrolase [Rickettsiales bacterium]